MPDVIGRTALMARVAMATLAVAWWGSLIADAALGRASWWSPVLAGGVLLCWAAVLWHQRAGQAGSTALPGAEHAHGPALHWHRATSSWHDASGGQVLPQVVFDLGHHCLLRVVPSGALLAPPRAKGHASYHWIDASPAAGHLSGAWRWRVMMASSRSLTPATIPLPKQFQRPARRPA